MKAERRHELKTNALARWIEEFPAFVKQHANRLMLGLILILLVILALQYRARVNAESMATAEKDLAEARLDVDQLRSGQLSVATTQDAAGRRTTLTDLADKALSDVLLSMQGDPSMQSRAQLTRGDLYLTLSMFPDLPGADTQPALALPRSREEYRKLAEEAYQKVLDIPEAQALSRNSARLGLAALAENGGDWQAARKWYNEVVNDSEAGPALQTYALERLQNDFTTTQPVLLAGDQPPAPPTTEPATNPAATATPGIGSGSPFMPELRPNDVIPTPATQPARAPLPPRAAQPAGQPATKPG
jgi:hypothetical protein